MFIVVKADGSVSCLYGEEIDLSTIGSMSARRASHVEPEGEEWFADMSPVGGPKLGPFRKRSEALAAEIKWMEDFLCRTS